VNIGFWEACFMGGFISILDLGGGVWWSIDVVVEDANYCVCCVELKLLRV